VTVLPKLVVITILLLMISIWSAFDWSNGMTHGYNDAVRRLRHKRFHEGILLLTKEARDGNAAAQFRLGLMNEFGAGAVRNAHHAQRWYRQSATLGYAPAKKRLDLIAADYLKAIPSLVSRAESGDQLARAQLGFAYLYGLGVQ